MAKTKQQIQTISEGWMMAAMQDIRGKFMHAMQVADATPDEVADWLGLPTTEVTKILEADPSIKLSTFTKLLVATDNVLEVKPVSESPIGSFERPNPMFAPGPGGVPGGFNHRPQHGFQNPPRNGAPRDPFMAPQPQPRHGFNGHGFQEENTPRRETSQFSSMSYDELADIITSKLWDSELDMSTASRKDLIDFLEKKERQYLRKKRAQEETHNPHHVAEPKGNHRFESPDAFQSELKKQIDRNPRLKKALEELFGK